MTNIYDIENKAKKEMIEFNHQKKLEMENIKLEMFEKKQNLMQRNIERLWGLKDSFLEKQNKMQLEKMYLYNKMKNNDLTDEDFKDKIKLINKETKKIVSND